MESTLLDSIIEFITFFAQIHLFNPIINIKCIYNVYISNLNINHISIYINIGEFMYRFHFPTFLLNFFTYLIQVLRIVCEKKLPVALGLKILLPLTQNGTHCTLAFLVT
ncbi:hypothetical protein HMPREF9374_3419 [Desmospora sp. 8437]|nr:hypothetical protein HMPREF9374_3419 [Desmospora sp. 8437]